MIKPGNEDDIYREMKSELMPLINKHFRPEFLNRIDDIIVFRALNRQNIKAIIDIQLVYLNERLSEKEITLRVSDEVKELIASRGFDPSLGARPLKRALDKLLTKPLSKGILSGVIKPESEYEAILSGDEVIFRRLESNRKASETGVR